MENFFAVDDKKIWSNLRHVLPLSSSRLCAFLWRFIWWNMIQFGSFWKMTSIMTNFSKYYVYFNINSFDKIRLAEEQKTNCWLRMLGLLLWGTGCCIASLWNWSHCTLVCCWLVMEWMTTKCFIYSSDELDT